MCDAFDDEWRAGRDARIEDYLERVSAADRGALLEDLLAIELWHRRRRGEQPSAAAYVERFANYAELVRKACALLPGEPGLTQASQHPQQITTLPKPVSASDSKKKEELPRLRPGITLGDYEIIKELGRGGMGVVYQAKHRLMRRIVAIKVLTTAASSDPEMVQRFLREVEMAAALNHPHIVTAYDAQQIDGLTFLVLEYVPGVDMASYVKTNGPLSPRTAMHCILQAARGLAHAHKAQIIHRDVKPHNLLYLPPVASTPSEMPSTQGAQYGTVKILDMGLARANWDSPKSTDLRLTNHGMIMGTVEYMSPEQAQDSRSADARSDIYSLGCTLHFLLTGKPPFVCSSISRTLQAHVDTPAPTLTMVDDGEPELRINTRRLQSIYEQMLEKNPDDRWQSMAEVVKALKECLPYDPGVTQAPPPKAILRKARPVDSQPPISIPPIAKPNWTYTWLAVIAVAVIVIVVTFWSQLMGN